MFVRLAETTQTSDIPLDISPILGTAGVLSQTEPEQRDAHIPKMN